MDKNSERRILLQPASLIAKPALLLDRDGVIIEDKHHLSDPNEVSLCPGSKELIQRAHHKDWRVVVLTNQSGIARGYFDWSDYERVTNRLLSLLGTSAPLAGIYANSHGPNAPAESWRKPSPNMLLEASRELNIDLENSLLIGDRLTDLKAGENAGVRNLVHVLTGHGHKERDSVKKWTMNKKSFAYQKLRPNVLFIENLTTFPMEIF